MLYFIILFIIFALSFATIFWLAIPKFLEQPKYTIIVDEGKFQVRNYEKLLLSQIQVSGAQKEALRKGFIPLARFIGAKDRDGEKISMTVPVMQKVNRLSSDWSVSFFMPSKYNLQSLPKTTNLQIESKIIPTKMFAALKFSGNPSHETLTQKETELSKILKKYGFHAVDDAIYAFYNDPLTPAFLRRNEVLIEVKK